MVVLPRAVAGGRGLACQGHLPAAGGIGLQVQDGPARVSGKRGTPAEGGAAPPGKSRCDPQDRSAARQIFRHTARAGGDDRAAAGHGLDGGDARRFLPQGGETGGVRHAVIGRQPVVGHKAGDWTRPPARRPAPKLPQKGEAASAPKRGLPTTSSLTEGSGSAPGRPPAGECPFPGRCAAEEQDKIRLGKAELRPQGAALGFGPGLDRGRKKAGIDAVGHQHRVLGEAALVESQAPRTYSLMASDLE